MKKIGILLTTVIMMMLFAVSVSAKEIAPTGKCGDNVYWNYNSSTGELVISGTGAMTNYTWYSSPFYDSYIKSVVIENNVTRIGGFAFQSCKNLESVTIQNGVVSIGDFAFSSCSSITSITIPASVTSISSEVFSYCTRLSNIIVDEKNNYYCCEDGVLFDKEKTRLLMYLANNTRMSYAIPDGVEFIDYRAFEDCENLTRITFPDSVTYIGGYAFNNCLGLTDIILPDGVTYIGYSAFGF